MAKGDENITEVKKRDGGSYSPKRWKVRFDCGTNPITGKREIISRTARGTKADARKLRDQIRAEHESGLAVDADKVTFREFAESWHHKRVNEGAVGAARLKREAGIIRDLNGYIGSMKLKNINAEVVENLYAQMRADKLEQNGKVSSTTMNMVHKLLKQILAKAVDYDIILRNPCDRVEAPKIDVADRRSLTTSEARDFQAIVEEAEFEAYEAFGDMTRREQRPTILRGLSSVGNIIGVRIAFATGMRRGELMGLTWSHVDLENGHIRVAQSMTAFNELKEPKSEAGKRVIAIDPITVESLRTWKQFQADALAILELKQSKDTPVCCSDKGGFLNPTNYSRWWRAFAEAHGFKGLKLHELRHTQATQLVANGVDMKTVQYRLGHSSATLTMNLYAHALPENDEKAAALIGNLFSSAPEANEDEGMLLTA